MNVKKRIEKLETKTSPEPTELAMALWQIHLRDHPDDDPLPPYTLRGMTLEQLVAGIYDES